MVAIIGTGRVGLPLALSLAEHGHEVIGIDIDNDLVTKANMGEMPFMEKGCNELISKKKVKFESEYSVLKDVSDIIITVGTPLIQHVETDLEYIKSVIKSIIPFLKKNDNIILRSTVAPYTTQFLRKTIEKETVELLNWKSEIGKDLFLSFCPERLAEGKALKELTELPQIIGADDEESFLRAKEIFKVLKTDIIKVSSIEAELSKLFCNTARYMQFSTVNYLAIIAQSYNCDIHKLLNIINEKYPRPIYGTVGLCSGTCLRKDWGMINESIPYADMLLSAYKINEFMPKFLVDQAKIRIKDFIGKKVGVLGYSFKKDCDDIRDSLTPKFIRYLEREVPEKIYVNDPNTINKLDCQYPNKGLNFFIKEVDVVFILMNHTIYIEHFEKIYSIAKNGCLFVDLWNVSGKNKMFFIKEDMVIENG